MPLPCSTLYVNLPKSYSVETIKIMDSEGGDFLHSLCLTNFTKGYTTVLCVDYILLKEGLSYTTQGVIPLHIANFIQMRCK